MGWGGGWVCDALFVSRTDGVVERKAEGRSEEKRREEKRREDERREDERREEDRREENSEEVEGLVGVRSPSATDCAAFAAAASEGRRGDHGRVGFLSDCQFIRRIRMVMVMVGTGTRDSVRLCAGRNNSVQEIAIGMVKV